MLEWRFLMYFSPFNAYSKLNVYLKNVYLITMVENSIIIKINVVQVGNRLVMSFEYGGK